jgi:hypothetical protein
MVPMILPWILAAASAFAFMARAADTTLPPVPEVLAPLNAKVRIEGKTGCLFVELRTEQPISEDQWKALESLGVKGLGIGGKGISDETLARVAALDPVVLSLDGASAITDDCCQYLAKMKSLRRISMGHMLQKEFTGRNLSMLKDLPSLEALTLAGAATGATAMEAIGHLTQLKELGNWHTRHSDPLNPYLLNLTNLKSLYLGRNSARLNGKNVAALNDSTFDTLAQLKSLEKLSISECRLSYAALEKLKALPNLKQVLLTTRVDIQAEDFEKLKAALPGVSIQWKPLTEEDRQRLDAIMKDD